MSSPSHSHPPTEAIIESALYKCVLKPLKEAINSCLHEIHSKDGSLQQLKDNQLVILATTTTDLGITTSVPEVPIMEKILQKFASMHKAYSPEKKISILLKTCKLIYDSMALGNPGRWHPEGPGLGALSRLRRYVGLGLLPHQGLQSLWKALGKSLRMRPAGAGLGVMGMELLGISQGLPGHQVEGHGWLKAGKEASPYQAFV